MAAINGYTTRTCAACEDEREQGERDTAGPEWKPCEVCDEPTCLEHGHEYVTGFEHPACHETLDFTRADDGQY